MPPLPEDALEMRVSRFTSCIVGGKLTGTMRNREIMAVDHSRSARVTEQRNQVHDPGLEMKVEDAKEVSSIGVRTV